jgi:hypothetical protein
MKRVTSSGESVRGSSFRRHQPVHRPAGRSVLARPRPGGGCRIAAGDSGGGSGRETRRPAFVLFFGTFFLDPTGEIGENIIVEELRAAAETPGAFLLIHSRPTPVLACVDGRDAEP